MKEFEKLMGVDKPMFRKEDFRFGDNENLKRIVLEAVLEEIGL